MPVYAEPPVVAPNDVVASTIHNGGIRQPIMHLRQLLPDPSSNNQILVSQTGGADGTAAFVAGLTAVLNGLGYTPVNKAGDTMTGGLQVLLDLVVAATGGASGAARLYEAGGSAYSLLQAAASVLNILRSPDGTGLILNWSSGQLTWLGNTVWHAGNDGTGSGLVADLLRGFAPSATPAAGVIAVADGTGKLDGWVTASGGVPSGFGGWVRQASEIPTGYTRESALDGRIPVGAGTTFSTTFTEATNYGAAWSFTPTDSGHSHGMAAAGVGGATGGPSALNGLATAGGVNLPTPTHTHDNGTLDVTGSSDGASAVITSTTWTIPSRGVVWVRRN